MYYCHWHPHNLIFIIILPAAALVTKAAYLLNRICDFKRPDATLHHSPWLPAAVQLYSVAELRFTHESTNMPGDVQCSVLQLLGRCAMASPGIFLKQNHVPEVRFRFCVAGANETMMFLHCFFMLTIQVLGWSGMRE